MKAAITSSILEIITKLIDEGEDFKEETLVNRSCYVVQSEFTPEDALVLGENLSYKGITFSVYLPADPPKSS